MGSRRWGFLPHPRFPLLSSCSGAGLDSESLQRVMGGVASPTGPGTRQNPHPCRPLSRADATGCSRGRRGPVTVVSPCLEVRRCSVDARRVDAGQGLSPDAPGFCLIPQVAGALRFLPKLLSFSDLTCLSILLSPNFSALDLTSLQLLTCPLLNDLTSTLFPVSLSCHSRAPHPPSPKCGRQTPRASNTLSGSQ